MHPRTAKLDRWKWRARVNLEPPQATGFHADLASSVSPSPTYDQPVLRRGEIGTATCAEIRG